MLRQQAREGRATSRICCARRLRRAARERRAPTTSAPSPSPPGLGADALAARFEARARRLPRDHGQGARRPPRRGVRRVPARARAPRVGLRAATSGSRTSDLDRGEVPRHPPGLRLPGLPRPHREARRSSSCSTRRAVGITLTEHFAMLPAASVSGLYLAPPRGALLHRRPHRPRPGRGLRAPQGAVRSPRSSAGWRRTWATIRRRPAPPRPERRATTRRPARGRSRAPARRRCPRSRARGTSPRSGAPPAGAGSSGAPR